MVRKRIVAILFPPGSFRARRAFLGIIVLVLLLTGFLAYYVPKRMESDRLATIQIGNEIVKALEAYQKNHGGYPASLKDLVPDYLPEIKTPPWGDSGWKYGGSPAQLEVGFDSHGEVYPKMIYQPGLGWVCDS